MRKLIVGNLKMNLITFAERERYLGSFKKALAKKEFLQTQIVLCPPVIHLESFQKASLENIKLGVQNVFWEEVGSYTGEISSSMLKGLGCEYVILGHSERRRYFNEDDRMVNLKVKAALKNNLAPIICVGETLEERQTGLTLQVITRQVKEIFAGVPQSRLEGIVIAYEPVWSVGSDVVPTTNDIMEARVLIRKILMQGYAKKNVEKVRIIYGGSVSAETAEKTCVISGMDGALVGRESLTPVDFLKIVKIIDK